MQQRRYKVNFSSNISMVSKTVVTKRYLELTAILVLLDRDGRRFVVYLRLLCVLYSITTTIGATDVYSRRVIKTHNEELLDYMHRVDQLYCARGKFCGIYPAPEEFKTNVDGSCYRACPQDCHCDDDCVKFNDCCPDVNNGTFKTADDGMFSCFGTFLKPHRESSYYKMVSKCPDTFKNKTVAKFCEELRFFRDFEIRTFVTSNEGVTFANKYCALCNGVEDFHSWRLQISCGSLLTVPSSIPQENVSNIFWEDDECSLHVIRPTPYTIPVGALRECSADDTALISKCNVTGLWEVYNADVEEACLSYTHVFKNYRNPFCYICNNYTAYVEECKWDAFPKFTPFSAILDLGLVSYIKQPECGRGFRYDALKRKCREVYCAAGKWLKDIDKCVSVVRPRAAFYLLTIYYQASIELHDISCFNLSPKQEEFRNVVDTIKERAIKYLAPVGIESRSMSASVALWDVRNQSCYDRLVSETMVDLNTNYTLWWMKIELFLFWDGDSDVDLTEKTIYEFGLMDQIVSTSGFGDVVLKPTHRFNAEERMPLLQHSQVFSIIPAAQPPTAYTVVTKQLFCPFVIIEIDNSTYRITDEGSRLYIPALDYYVDPVDYSFMNGTFARICSQPYFNNTEKLWNNEPPVDKVLTILSIICICVSLVCLAITFIVYCLIKSLRTLPGKNNMALIICLFVAQVLMQFRPDPSDGYVICVISGIATQYFWLAAVLWMNVCSFHMFRVFGHIRVAGRATGTRDRRQLFLYTSYCHLVPVVVVSVTIAVSLSLFEELGYTSPICFLFNEYLLGLAFALPIAVIILANIVMFCLVVISIHRTSSSTKMVSSDRQYLHVYFRLSTITGATWIFGFIYMWTENIVCSYIFTVLNALQGLFLFIAFVCNSRVFTFLREKYMPPTSEDSVSLSKTANQDRSRNKNRNKLHVNTSTGETNLDGSVETSLSN